MLILSIKNKINTINPTWQCLKVHIFPYSYHSFLFPFLFFPMGILVGMR